MMKGVRIFFICLVLCFEAQAQNDSFEKRIDSLRILLENAGTDSVRAKLNLQIGSAYTRANADSADHYLAEALNIVRRSQLPEFETRILLEIGRQYLGKGDFPNALRYLNWGMKMATDHHLHRQMSTAYWYLGHLYDAMKEYKSVLDFRRKFYWHNRAFGYDNSQVAVLYLSAACSRNNLPDSASYYLKKVTDSLTYFTSEEMDEFASALGGAYELLGQSDSALPYLRRGVEAYIAKGDLRLAGLNTMILGRIYAKKGIIDSAKYYCQLTIDLGEEIGYVAHKNEAAQLLGELWEDSNPVMALQYYKMALETQENIYGVRNLQAIKAIELQQKEAEQQIEQAKFRNRQNLLVTGVTSLFIIAGLLFYYFNKQRRVNTLLSRQKSDVQQALTKLKSTQAQLIQSEKMASLGELTAGIAHEIQNPLNFVNNFSEINKELLQELKDEVENGNLAEVKAIADDLEANEEKIAHHGKRAGSIVKGMLEHSRKSDGQKEPTDINQLADECLRLAYHGMRAKDKTFNAEYKTEFDEKVPMVSMVSSDISRVLLNLINNAFYAVNERAKTEDDKYQPQVIVSTAIQNDKVMIAVQDNGKGIPDEIKDKIFQPFFTTKPTGSGTGLGLSLSYDIIKANGGELTVDSSFGDGANFEAILPMG